MSKQNYLTVTPVNPLDNVYDQKETIISNIAKIRKTLDNYKGLDISNNMYWEIVEVRKKEQKKLDVINNTISNIEQGSFPFGS